MLLLLLSWQLEESTLGLCLRRVQCKSSILNTLSRPRRKHQVGVKRSVPSCQEAALNLCILRQSGLSNTLRRKCVLLQSSSEWVLAGARVLLVEELGGGKGGTSDGVGEGLWLWLGGWWCGQGGLCFGWGSGGGEKLDLFGHAAAKVVQVLTDVAVVVALVGVGGTVNKTLAAELIGSGNRTYVTWSIFW